MLSIVWRQLAHVSWPRRRRLAEAVAANPPLSVRATVRTRRWRLGQAVREAAFQRSAHAALSDRGFPRSGTGVQGETQAQNIQGTLTTPHPWDMVQRPNLSICAVRLSSVLLQIGLCPVPSPWRERNGSWRSRAQPSDRCPAGCISNGIRSIVSPCSVIEMAFEHGHFLFRIPCK